MGLADRARALGGHPAYPADSTMVRIPAANAAMFVRQELELGNAVGFVECLYLHANGGVEPSMELSRARADFVSDEAMLSFVEDAARIAEERATAMRVSAYFEIDVP